MVTKVNGFQNAMVDMGKVAQYLHVFGEDLFFVKASVNTKIPELTMIRSPIMGNGKSQVLVAANGVGVFRHLHPLKVSHFAIAVKLFCKCLSAK